jgi:diaminopropionate ammonia-lyase
MSVQPEAPADPVAAQLLRLSPAYAPTPLVDLPRLAARLTIAQVLAKDEGRRILGSFKSLGGTYAGLRALARHARCEIGDLLDPERRPGAMPDLLCASDGNHGLAVAAAARFAGAGARIFLPRSVPVPRARRIEQQGAAVVRVDGTYDDAVDAAADEARRGRGILVADTTSDPSDEVVGDVMAGYGVIASEIRRKTEATGEARPTHLFVQAGVGGLAAAMADGLRGWMAPPATIVVVEPATTACVEAGLRSGRPVRLAGSLETSAEMLSCGEASAAALATLLRCGAKVVTVDEDALTDAPSILQQLGGPATTPSGAAGLAGLIHAASRARADLELEPSSRALVIITEAALGADPA